MTVRDEAMPVLAEAWLIARGADPSRLRERMRPSEFQAADAETEALEELLRHSGTRFDVHDSASSPSTPHVTWVITKDSEAPDPDRPVALFVGHRPVDSEAFTLRHGYFANTEDAYHWTRNPSAPLPQPGLPGAARAEAARLDRRNAAPPRPDDLGNEQAHTPGGPRRPRGQ